MYVTPPYCRANMYAGRVACCSLVSHGKYADGTDRLTDRRTDGHQTVTLRFPPDAASVIKPNKMLHKFETGGIGCLCSAQDFMIIS